MARLKAIESFMVLLILQWNTRSLLANGQELKHSIQNSSDEPDIICVQETWLKPNLDFVIKGYKGVRFDRNNEKGGGCMTFIKDGIPYRYING